MSSRMERRHLNRSLPRTRRHTSHQNFLRRLTKFAKRNFCMGRLITWMLSSVASFRFWLAQKRFKVHRDYNIQRAENDTILVEIIRGKYANVKFTYDDIK